MRLQTIFSFAALAAILLIFIPPDVALTAEQETQQSAENNAAEGFEADLGDDFSDEADEELADSLGDDFSDELGDDFSDSADSTSASSDDSSEEFEARTPPPYHFTGYCKLESSWNFAHKAPASGMTDWRGLSSLRAGLKLELEYKIAEKWRLFLSGNGFQDFAYSIKGRDDYTSEVLSRYENQVELDETYIQGRLTRKLDLKVGRQIIVWGKSDNIRVTDVLNPLDLREPGLTDLEDLRLPEAMTRLDFYYGKWSISGIAIHEHRYNKNPVYGHDFFPFEQPLPPEKEPATSLDNTEFAAAINGIFTGWDLSFYYADIYSDRAHVELFPYPLQYHAPVTMLGAAVNVAQGNFLWKTEAAYFDGIKFSDDSFYMAGMMPVRVLGQGTYARIDVLLGVEYSGFDDTTISFEAVNRHYANFSESAEAFGEKRDRFQSATRISRDFMNETLNLTVLASIYGLKGEDGAIYRFTAEYDWTDEIEIIGGVVLYNSGELTELSNIAYNDRVYCDIKYSF